MALRVSSGKSFLLVCADFLVRTRYAHKENGDCKLVYGRGTHAQSLRCERTLQHESLVNTRLCIQLVCVKACLRNKTRELTPTQVMYSKLCRISQDRIDGATYLVQRLQLYCSTNGADVILFCISLLVLTLKWPIRV